MAPQNDDSTSSSNTDAQRSGGESDPAPRTVIRSDRVHYPGLDARPSAEAPFVRPNGEARRLRPARDAGISIERRRARERRQAQATRRNRAIGVGLAVLAVLLLGIGWQWASENRAAQRPVPSRANAVSLPSFSPVVRQNPATPYFARYKDVLLRLPVAPSDLTEIGFHQASYGYALPLKTPLPDADMKTAKKEQTTHRDLSAQSTSADATLTGSVLRMWRNRPGKPNTAVDVGADPGTPVLAPTDGTVLLVKRYKLYGRYSDVQVHIRPDADSDVDVVVIHLKQPTVKAGDRVMSGVTPLGAVRKFSDKMNLQLEHYTEGVGRPRARATQRRERPELQGPRGRRRDERFLALVPGRRVGSGRNRVGRPVCRNSPCRIRANWAGVRSSLDEAPKASVELVAFEHHAPIATSALEPYVGAYARDLPLVGSTRMRLLEPDDIAESHGSDRNGHERPFDLLRTQRGAV